MNRVDVFQKGCDALLRLRGEQALTLGTRGTLAMAVSALEDDLKAEHLLRALENADPRNPSDAYYRVLFLAYDDWKSRVSPGKPQAYRAIVEALWLEKIRLGNRNELTDCELLNTYCDYPAFFRALDLMTSLTNGGGETQ